jgi:hypothetical protein
MKLFFTIALLIVLFKSKSIGFTITESGLIVTRDDHLILFQETGPTECGARMALNYAGESPLTTNRPVLLTACVQNLSSNVFYVVERLLRQDFTITIETPSGKTNEFKAIKDGEEYRRITHTLKSSQQVTMDLHLAGLYHFTESGTYKIVVQGDIWFEGPGGDGVGKTCSITSNKLLLEVGKPDKKEP